MPPSSPRIVHAGKYMWAVAFAAGMGGMLFGYEIGIINQILAIDNFKRYFGIWYDEDGITYTDDVKKGLVTSSFLYGCVVGAAAVSLLADAIGRKFSIILGGIIYTAGGCLQAASVKLYVFLLARALSGVSVGIMSMSVPLYIAETSPSSIRGRLTTVYQLMITFGILIASCLNGIIITVLRNDNTYNNDERPWRIAFLLQVVPGLTLLILMLPMPRSPRWLAEKGFHGEGQRVIARLRGFEDEEEDEVVVEYRSIVAGVEYERRIGTAGWSQLFKKGVRRRLALGVVNQFFQQWTGINVILYYGYDLFKQQLQFGDLNSSVEFIIINAFINFAFTLPGMWGVERFGRRPLFIYGGMAMCASYVVVFIFGFVAQRLQDEGRPYAWVAVLGIYSFTISFACTWGPVVWTYQSEIFPLRIRAKGTGLSTMSNWLWNAVIAQIQPSISTALSAQFFLIFVGTCLVMTVYAWKFIPETRGKTLEEMDEVFKDSDAVLPSENVEWTATVAAMFSLQGIHSPPNSGLRRDGGAGSATAFAQAKSSSVSLSTLSPPSAGSSSGLPTLDDIDKMSYTSASSRGRDKIPLKGEGPLASPQLGQHSSALDPRAFSQLMAGATDYSLSPTLATPYSPTRKPKTSAMKKTSAGTGLGLQPPYTPADDISLGAIPLSEYSYPLSSASSITSSLARQRSRSFTSTISRPDDDRSATPGTGIAAGLPSPGAGSGIVGGGVWEYDPAEDCAASQQFSANSGNGYTVDAPQTRPGRSMIVPQWPPSFVVRLGQTRAGQQLQQSLRSSGRRSSADLSSPPSPGEAPQATATPVRPPSPSWRRAVGLEPSEQRSFFGSGGGGWRGRQGGTANGSTTNSRALFALPTAPPRSPRSRSVDTGRSSASDGRFGLGNWMIEEDDGAEISRR